MDDVAVLEPIVEKFKRKIRSAAPVSAQERCIKCQIGFYAVRHTDRDTDVDSFSNGSLHGEI